MKTEATFWGGDESIGHVHCSIRDYAVTTAADAPFDRPFPMEDAESSGSIYRGHRSLLWTDWQDTEIEAWSSQDARVLWAVDASRLPARAARAVKVSFGAGDFYYGGSYGVAGLGMQWLPDTSTRLSVEAASPRLLAEGAHPEVWESIEVSMRWLKSHPLLASLGGGRLRIAWFRHCTISALKDTSPEAGIGAWFALGDGELTIAKSSIPRLFSGLVFACLRALHIDIEANHNTFGGLCEAPVAVPWEDVYRGLVASSEARRSLSLSALTPAFDRKRQPSMWPTPQGVVSVDALSDESLEADGCLRLESRLGDLTSRISSESAAGWLHATMDVQPLDTGYVRSLFDYDLIVRNKAQIVGDPERLLALEEALEALLHHRHTTLEWERAYSLLASLDSANVGSIWLRLIEAFDKKTRRRCLYALGAWSVCTSAENLGLWLSRESKGTEPPEGWVAFGIRMRSQAPSQAACNAGALLASLHRTSFLAMLFSIGTQTFKQAAEQEFQRQLMQGVGHFVASTSCAVAGCCLSTHQNAMPRKRRSRNKYIKRIFETLLASDPCDNRHACAMGAFLNALEGRGDIEEEQLQHLAQDLEAMLFF